MYNKPLGLVREKENKGKVVSSFTFFPFRSLLLLRRKSIVDLKVLQSKKSGIVARYRSLKSPRGWLLRTAEHSEFSHKLA